MKNCLLIMHAREIPQCVEAIHKLRIDKAWFRGFTELQLESVIPDFIDNDVHSYDNYIVLSDDTVPTQKALDCVVDGLERHEVFTGWCNISPNSDLCTIHEGRLSIPGAHRWKTISQIFMRPDEFETPFACFALTGARKEIWQRFPFRTYVSRREAHGPLIRTGWGSDFSFSLRLQDAKIPIYSHRDAFVQHLASRENFIVGKTSPETILEPKDGGAVLG